MNNMKEQLEELLKKWEAEKVVLGADKMKFLANPFVQIQCNAEIERLNNCIRDLKQIIQQHETTT